MRRKVIAFVLAAILALTMLAGCGSNEAEDTKPSTSPPKKPIPTDAAKTPYPHRLSEEESAGLFESLPETFTLASGAGGWETVLTINSDGTFSGNYHDSELSLSDADHPDGTCYICNFTGSFVDITQISGKVYRMKLKDLKTDSTPGESYIENGTEFVYSEPLGLTDTETFFLYMPGATKDELPIGFKVWSGFGKEQELLPDNLFGIYNKEDELAFLGYAAE